jgi:hypothetical protein
MSDIVLATSAQTFNGAPIPGLTSDNTEKSHLPLCVANTVDISNGDLCLLERFANQLERPFAMMLRRVPREKSLSRRRDVCMSDIGQDKRRSALLRVLYYAHPDLVCTPFNPQTDHLVELVFGDASSGKSEKFGEFGIKRARAVKIGVGFRRNKVCVPGLVG